VRKALEAAASAWRGYADPDDGVPMAGYALMSGIFIAGFALLVTALGRSHRLPRRVRVPDLVLTGLATHRLSRILTRDKIATPLRAPLTEYEGSAGAGEVHERVRVHGVRKALASLVTCPYCAAPWLASALLAGLAVRPRITHFIEAMLTSVTISDFTHQLYAATKRLS